MICHLKAAKQKSEKNSIARVVERKSCLCLSAID